MSVKPDLSHVKRWVNDNCNEHYIGLDNRDKPIVLIKKIK